MSESEYTIGAKGIISDLKELRTLTADASGAHHFEFLDGVNLLDPGASHEHAFWIRADPAGTITRNETYILNGAAYDATADSGSSEVFRRAE